MWTLSDEALLAGLGSGDPDAAATFVNRFQRRVFGMTLSVLRDHQAAEEAAQEAFVRAWRHASTYDPRKGTAAAWLVLIARNVAINMLPSHRPDPVGPAGAGGIAGRRALARRGPGRPAGAGFRADAEGADAPARRAAAGPGAGRLLGYTAREVSEQDGTPVSTVKTRIRAALMRLRSELGVSDER
jgi:RNA polymerase sigma-70 factor (ECF subfamily)